MIYPTALQAKSNPDSPAIIDADSTITYADLEGRLVEAVSRLRRMGVSGGDRVATCALQCGHAVTCQRLADVRPGVEQRRPPLVDHLLQVVEIETLVGDGTYEARVSIVDSLGEHWDHTTSVEVLGFKDRTRVPIRVEISGNAPASPGGTE